MVRDGRRRVARGRRRDGPRPRLDDPGARPDRGHQARDPRPALATPPAGRPRGDDVGRPGDRRPRSEPGSTAWTMDQRTQATFPFETPERFVWATRPARGEGLAIRDMRPDQRAASSAIVAAAMSCRTAGEIARSSRWRRSSGSSSRRAAGPAGSGATRAVLVRGVRRAGSATPWSWRIGGHHVAVHVTVADDRVVGTTPSFLGANPAVDPERAPCGRADAARARRGWPAPPGGADAGGARRRPDRRRRRRPTSYRDRSCSRTCVPSPSAIRHADLGAPRQAALERLIRHYVERVAARGRGERRGSGSSPPASATSTFAWAGSDAPGRGHYYAVRGPSFVIEYDNTQNGANHIHAVWRDLDNDWGEDGSAEHLSAAHAAQAPTTRRDSTVLRRVRARSCRCTTQLGDGTSVLASTVAGALRSSSRGRSWPQVDVGLRRPEVAGDVHEVEASSSARRRAQWPAVRIDAELPRRRAVDDAAGAGQSPWTSTDGRRRSRCSMAPCRSHDAPPPTAAAALAEWR